MRIPAWIPPTVAILVAAPAMVYFHHEAWLPIRPGAGFAETIYYDPARVSTYDLPHDIYHNPPKVSLQDEPSVKDWLLNSKEGWVLAYKGEEPYDNPREVLRQHSKFKEDAHTHFDRVVWSMPILTLILGTWLGAALTKRRTPEPT